MNFVSKRIQKSLYKIRRMMMKDLHLTSRSSIFTQTGNFNKVIVKPFVREKQGHTVHRSEVVDKYGKRQTNIQRIDKYNIRIFIKPFKHN